MIKPRMTACLKQLHLPAFVEHYAPQAALAGNEGWPYDRYLLGLCELELTEREQRRIQRLLTDSKLPREKTLEAFDRNRVKKTVDRQFAVLMGRRLPQSPRKRPGLRQSRRRKNASSLCIGDTNWFVKADPYTSCRAHCSSSGCCWPKPSCG
jgi:hypothetical protein